MWCVKNSIIAENTGYSDIGHRGSGNGTIVESGYNIFGRSTSTFTPAESNSWTDEDRDQTYTKIGDASTGSLNIATSLADNDTVNGTQTFALSAGSIAIDAGDAASHNSIAVPTADQRGAERAGSTDVGAFEYGGIFPEEGGSVPSQTSSSPGLSAPQPEQCSDARPAGAPDLFQISVRGTQAELYLTPLLNTDQYFVSFSTEPSAEAHGALLNLGSDGVQRISIYALSPSTTYHFKVRGHYGCMPGEWSAPLAAQTGTSVLSEVWRMVYKY